MHRSLITPLRTLALVTGLLLVASVLPSRWSSWVSRPAKATLTTLATPITRPTRWVAQAVRSPAPNWQLEGDRGALSSD